MAKAKKNDTMLQYTVTGRIEHNGNTYKPGDLIELSETEAVYLEGFLGEGKPVEVKSE
jgi:hypothetical protein